jgi:hypothetical protein
MILVLFRQCVIFVFHFVYTCLTWILIYGYRIFCGFYCRNVGLHLFVVKLVLWTQIFTLSEMMEVLSTMRSLLWKESINSERVNNSTSISKYLFSFISILFSIISGWWYILFLYHQSRKVSGHVFVCYGYILFLFLPCFYDFGIVPSVCHFCVSFCGTYCFYITHYNIKGFHKLNKNMIVLISCYSIPGRKFTSVALKHSSCKDVPFGNLVSYR